MDVQINQSRHNDFTASVQYLCAIIGKVQLSGRCDLLNFVASNQDIG